MTENVQNGTVSELVDILTLLTNIAVRKINLQHVLFLAAFLTFGIGDGVTAAFMMEKIGVGIEANPVIRYLFMAQGFMGIVKGKIWITIMILVAVYIVELSSSSKMYWTVNGFLIALTAGGLMAIYANLSAMAGEIPQAPGAIIIAYLFLMFILTEIGSFVDGGMKHGKTKSTGS